MTTKGDRITLVIDHDLVLKIRNKQADLIKKSIKSVSFSYVANKVLRGVIKL